jgi:hypothetical protein
VRLIVHEPIATSADENPNPRAVRALAQRAREIIRPDVEAEADAGV